MASRSLEACLRLAIAVGLLMGACAGPSAAPNAAPTSVPGSLPSAASPEPSTPSTPTTSPSTPGASAPVTVDLGEAGITPLGSRVTVHAFGPSDRSLEPPAGAAWLEADLEWCLPQGMTREVKLGNIRYEVALEMSDGSTIDPEADADSPDEVYASDGTFRANECVRGPLVFAVPTGATPTYLLLVGRNGAVRWRLA
jgi:hypothetical protein